jgi:hypothetical protein
MHTPELGLFQSTVSPHGDIMINENQINRLFEENLASEKVVDELERLLGKRWDFALEPYRVGRENLESKSDKVSS